MAPLYWAKAWYVKESWTEQGPCIVAWLQYIYELCSSQEKIMYEKISQEKGVAQNKFDEMPLKIIAAKILIRCQQREYHHALTITKQNSFQKCDDASV